VRVTFVAPNYFPSRGGAQEYVRQLAEGLAARGHRVTVLTTTHLRSPAAREPGSIAEGLDVVGGVEVRRFATPRPVAQVLRVARIATAMLRRRRPHASDKPMGPWLSGPWSPRLILAVRSAVRSDDVVVGAVAPYTSLTLPVALRRFGRARLATMPLLHLTAADPPNAVLRALRRSDAVLASTEFEAAADRSFGVPAARVSVIPPGVSAATATDLDPRDARHHVGLPERPTVGFIGRLAEYKGILTLLEAAPELWRTHPEVTILLAGSPIGWDAYRTALDEHVSQGRLVIREGFAEDERSWLMSACDIVVHPSREESFGLIALEAWAAHRPVVLGDIPAVRSFIRPGEDAELVAPTDAAGLAAVLGELLDDPDRCRRLAVAGHAEIAERFAWERVCDAWDGVLRALAPSACAVERAVP
jgi:glycosyltransferase involved in cell wall biosynthesis